MYLRWYNSNLVYGNGVRLVAKQRYWSSYADQRGEPMNSPFPPSYNTQILDCTLRDGAHVNGGHFGQANIDFMIRSLCMARVDIVEVGFIQKGVVRDPDSVYFDSFEAVDALLDTIERQSSAFAAMIRVDEFDVENMKPS